MAKIYGLFGAMTGKLADTVMSVRNGEQIARKYQPVVFNPSTPAQVAQRAKMKLLSQLSAVVALGIGFKRQGPVSARNLFTKKNFVSVAYDAEIEKASIDVANVDLSGGVIALPGITPTRTSGQVRVTLASPDSELDAVVYVTIAEQSDGKLRLVDMRVITDPGVSSDFATPDFNVDSAYNGYVLAYGVRYDSENARATYGDLSALTPAAFIQVIRNDNTGGVTLTETKGATFPAFSA